MIGHEFVKWIGPSRIPDNEEQLLKDIVEILRYSDAQFHIVINRKDDIIMCHVTPSKPMFKPDIVTNLRWVNKHLGVKIRFSSSLAISKKVSFTIGTSDKDFITLHQVKQLHIHGTETKHQVHLARDRNL